MKSLDGTRPVTIALSRRPFEDKVVSFKLKNLLKAMLMKFKFKFKNNYL